jgi:hypothetical protein
MCSMTITTLLFQLTIFIGMKIISREQAELNAAERKVLAKIRRKKTIFLVTAYVALVAILAFVYMTGMIKSQVVTAEKNIRLQRGTMIFSGVSFIAFTVIFIFQYIKTVHPYTRDLRNGLKTISWFYPAAYKTPFFDSFFLKTGSRKRPMLSIHRELYDAIRPGVLACILFAPASRCVLLLDIDGRRMEFNEENTGLEL